MTDPSSGTIMRKNKKTTSPSSTVSKKHRRPIDDDKQEREVSHKRHKKGHVMNAKHGGLPRRGAASASSSEIVMSVETFAHAKSKGTAKAMEGYRKRKEVKRIHTAKELRKYHKLMKQQGYEPGSGASRKRRIVEEHDGDGCDEDAESVDRRHGPLPPHSGIKKSADADSSSSSDDDHDAHKPNERADLLSGDNDSDQVDDDEGHRVDAALASRGGRRRPVKLKAAAATTEEETDGKRYHDHRKHSKVASDLRPGPATGTKQVNSQLQRIADKRQAHIRQEHERKRQQDKIRAEKLRERRQRTKLLGQRTRKGQPVMKNVVHDILRKLEREQQQQQQQQQSLNAKR